MPPSSIQLMKPKRRCRRLFCCSALLLAARTDKCCSFVVSPRVSNDRANFPSALLQTHRVRFRASHEQERLKFAGSTTSRRRRAALSARTKVGTEDDEITTTTTEKTVSSKQQLEEGIMNEKEKPNGSYVSGLNDDGSTLNDGMKDKSAVSMTEGNNTKTRKQQQQQPQPFFTSNDILSKKFVQEKLFLGIEPTPEILAIVTIYFVEGAVGLARLAQTFLLKDELRLGPAELSALTGFFTLPWTIKPLYGFLSDGFPLFGYRRRSYLIAAGLLGCLSYVALGFDFWGAFGSSPGGSHSDSAVSAAAAAATMTAASEISSLGGWLSNNISVLQATVVSLLVGSACVAFSDVVADGIVVQRTRESNDPKVAGGLQSLCWGSAAIGGLISAYFSGSLLEIIGPREVFALTAFLPLTVAGIALLIDEKPIGSVTEILPTETVSELTLEGDVVPSTNGETSSVSPLVGIKGQVKALWSAIKEPGIWRPALFLFLWQSTPTSDGAFLYFITNDLGMGPEFLGRVRLVTAAAGLFGVWLYQKYLRSVPIKDILFWTTIASMPLGLSSLLLITHTNRALGIPDGAFVFGDDVALAILGQIGFLPTLVLAARICPPGVEAVLFATLMSINNGASALGTEIGAGLTKLLGVTESNFGNMGLLTIICNISSLYPLLFIGWLDDVGSKSEEELDTDGVYDVAKLPDDTVQF